MTPMPPAAQIEIRPRPEPRSASCLASVATMRAPVAAKGWPMATLEPFGFILSRSMDPERAARSSLLPAEVLGFPGLQRAQHLRGERLVDLVDVEVLQLEPGAVEHARHRVGRRHQHAFLRPAMPTKSTAAVSVMAKECLHRDVARLRPFFGRQQHARGAVGERRAVAGGERAGGAAVERGAQRRRASRARYRRARCCRFAGR